MAEKIEICVVRKTYNGLEGHRVKAGTRFAVGQARGGLPVISNARYQALAQSKIVGPLGKEDAKAAPGARPLGLTMTHASMQGTAGPTARNTRQRARTRIKATEETPAPPKQVAGPQNGSQTGEVAPPSSSAEGPASKKSTSTRRGTRPSASSPSITPSR